MIGMKNQDACVLCFVKYPEKGQVKLRLAVDLDDDIVVELYRNFVLDVVSILKKLDTPFYLCFCLLYTSPSPRDS